MDNPFKNIVPVAGKYLADYLNRQAPNTSTIVPIGGKYAKPLSDYLKSQQQPVSRAMTPQEEAMRRAGFIPDQTIPQQPISTETTKTAMSTPAVYENYIKTGRLPAVERFSDTIKKLGGSFLKENFSPEWEMLQAAKRGEPIATAYLKSWQKENQKLKQLESQRKQAIAKAKRAGASPRQLAQISINYSPMTHGIGVSPYMALGFVGALNFVSPQVAEKMIAKGVASKLTRQDLIDITRGKMKNPVKLRAYKTMTSDPAMKKELLAIAKNKKISPSKSIADHFKEALNRIRRPRQTTEATTPQLIGGNEKPLSPKAEQAIRKELPNLKKTLKEIPTAPIQHRIELLTIALRAKKITPELENSLIGFGENAPEKPIKIEPKPKSQPKIPKELELSINELKGLPKGVKITNPRKAFKIGEIPQAITTRLGIPRDVEITRQAVKHILERRGEDADGLIRDIPDIISNPSKIARAKIKNGFLFAKMNGKARGTVLQVIKKPDKNQVVSVFRINKKSFLKLKDVSGRPAVPPSFPPKGGLAASRISALQKHPVIRIAKPKGAVKGWQKISGYPNKGDYVKTTWRGKTYEGKIIGDRAVNLRGFIARQIETPEGKKVFMPWTSRAEYYVRTTKPVQKSLLKETPKPTPKIEKPKIEQPIKQEIKQPVKQPAKQASAGAGKKPPKEPNEIVRAFHPTKGVSPEIRQQFRGVLAKLQRERDIFEKESTKRAKVFDKLSKDKIVDFWDRLERGTSQENEKLQSIAKYYRETFDKDYADIKTYKDYVGYIKNYFPHIWKDPQKAVQVLGIGKRPLRGTTTRFRHRIIQYIKEGIDKGLEPASWNPEELFSLTHFQNRKFVLMSQLWEQWKKAGIPKFVKFGQRTPEGYAQVNDSIANVLEFSEERGGLIQRGHYVLPAPIARMVNNYLSPGLRRFQLYRSALVVKNSLNALQLGFSAFHGLMTGFNAGISGMARGILGIKYGIVDKNPKLIARGLGQITLHNPATLPYDILKSLIKGHQIKKEWFAPGTTNNTIAKITQIIEKAGGRARMPQFYNITNARFSEIGQALKKGNIPKVVLQSILKALHGIQKPILQWYVPHMKLGVINEEISHWMIAHPNATDQEILNEAVRIVDSVDNRFGELIYDNLFWNRNLKDSMMIGIRALGWNVGTVREVGGGTINLARLKIDRKSTYVLALLVYMGMAGAIYEYLKGIKIKGIKDLYAPRTGRKMANGADERIVFPSYMKDIMSLMYQGPLITVKNKANPVLSELGDILKNADYFGTMIRNPNDPISKQTATTFDYLIRANMPFAIQGYMKRKRTGAPASEAIASFAGINPAPSYVAKTPLQKKITDLYVRGLPKYTTPEERKKLSARSALREKIYRGKATAQDIIDAVKKGYIKPTRKAIFQFIRDSKLPGDIRQFKGLKTEDQIRILRMANKQELKRYAPYIHKNFMEKLKAMKNQ